MTQTVPRDLEELTDAFAAVDADAARLLEGLPPGMGEWRREPDAWSIAECLDHLAVTNRAYLAPMSAAAERALSQNRMRRAPATPGLVGRWFARTLEPPVRARRSLKAPKKIRPRPAVPLESAARAFFASQREIRDFIARYAAIDLARVRFANPFVRGVRFSLATGLHVLAAHDRRHLWQAWNIRRTASAGLGKRDHHVGT